MEDEINSLEFESKDALSLSDYSQYRTLSDAMVNNDLPRREFDFVSLEMKIERR